MRYLKKLLICVYVFLGVFAVATLIVFICTGSEPSTLVGCTFGVAGVESMLAAVIKASEAKKESGEVKKDGDTVK